MRSPRARRAGSSSCLRGIYGRNAFYTRKLEEAGIADRPRCGFPDDLATLPVTTKAELVADQDAHPPWGTALTEPLERYTRYNQTSSTTGQPLRWLDTNESWQWMLDCWKAVYRGARVGPGDRILFAFSFGPFLGFWTAFDAASQIGAHARARRRHVEPAAPRDDRRRRAHGRLLHADLRAPAGRGGGRGSAGRPAAVPTAASACVIVAGEPGGSIPATRERIERELGRARHRSSRADRSRPGRASSAGKARGACTSTRTSSSARCSIRSTLGAGRRRAAGRTACITNLGRTASPVIRYRTGDVVVRRIGAVRVRPDAGAARGRHPRAHRRHGEHPRRQRLPGGDRVGRPPFRGGGRVSIDRVARPARCDRSSVEVELTPSAADPRAIVTKAGAAASRGAGPDGADSDRRARRAAAVRDEGPAIRGRVIRYVGSCSN